ncbi:hypothetical protein [Nocardia sp. NBC_01329]|uniref:hypothetical protein n=1 Tax=Nocardia sp. NBC_01329 TaxID=2903594 RepID=UPI002E12AAA4
MPFNMEKRGRVRYCRIGPDVFEREMAWLQGYRQMLEARMDRLGEFLRRTEHEQ